MNAVSSPDPSGITEENGPRLWRKGDGVWVVAGDRCGHAGEVLRDQKPGETEVWVAVRGGTDKDPQDVTGQWSVTALQPYRWIPTAERERLHNLIRKLYPKGKRTTVRAWDLADFLMMHGLVFEEEMIRAEQSSGVAGGGAR